MHARQPGSHNGVRTLAVGLALATSACGGSDDPAGPDGNGSIINGIAMTGQVIEIVHTQTSVKQVTIRVTLTNTGNAPVTLAYLATCPVRFRLYRVLDQSLVYDETALPCSNLGAADITIAPQESRELNSGVRNPWTIHGDSIVMGSYSAAGVVHVVGAGPVEVDAGIYLLPNCAERLNEVTATCTYPPASIRAAAR